MVGHVQENERLSDEVASEYRGKSIRLVKTFTLDRKSLRRWHFETCDHIDTKRYKERWQAERAAEHLIDYLLDGPEWWRKRFAGGQPGEAPMRDRARREARDEAESLRSRLEQVTIERGYCQSEVETAREKLEKLGRQ
jgi:hypothetical protein